MDYDYYRAITPTEERVAGELHRMVEGALTSIGLLCRVFVRVKSADSIDSKQKKRTSLGRPYSKDGDRMQDFFGIRVVLYFADDVDVAQRVLRKIFKYDSDSIDSFTGEQFGPVRYNIVFRLPENIVSTSLALQKIHFLDETFEVQFRTVLSEGWHEVEHDLRYKRKSSWNDHDDLSRIINAILATLEGSDWTLLKVFDELARRHYKSGNYEEMMHAKFRLRFRKIEGTSKVWSCLNNDPLLAKAIFRIDRTEYLSKITELSSVLPVTPENAIYIANRFFISNEQIRKLEPPPVAAVLERWVAQHSH